SSTSRRRSCSTSAKTFPGSGIWALSCRFAARIAAARSLTTRLIEHRPRGENMAGLLESVKEPCTRGCRSILLLVVDLSADLPAWARHRVSVGVRPSRTNRGKQLGKIVCLELL